jgi:hypothetical protein
MRDRAWKLKQRQRRIAAERGGHVDRGDLVDCGTVGSECGCEGEVIEVGGADDGSEWDPCNDVPEVEGDRMEWAKPDRRMLRGTKAGTVERRMDAQRARREREQALPECMKRALLFRKYVGQRVLTACDTYGTVGDIT